MDTLNNKLIESKNLTYKVKDKFLINDISIQINKGDMVSIIGPNGSGKSTLMKLFSGEINPTNGYIKIQNKLINEWDMISLAKERSILSQTNNLSFPFRVIDIVKMGRYPYFNDQNNNRKICELLIRKFDLKNYINRNYTTLSGGEKQRVHLARIFSQIWSDNFESKVVLLDEPTSFLDIKHQFMLFKFLFELNLKGLTVVMVLHDINQAIDVSKKIIMLKDSKLLNFSNQKDCITTNNLKKLFDIDLDITKNNKLDKKIITFKN